MRGRAAHTWPVTEFHRATQAQVRTLRPSTWHVLRNDRGMVHCWDAALTLTARTSRIPGPSFSSVSQDSQEDSSDPAGRAGFHGKPASIWLLVFRQPRKNTLSKRFVWVMPSAGRRGWLRKAEIVGTGPLSRVFSLDSRFLSVLQYRVAGGPIVNSPKQGAFALRSLRIGEYRAR